MNQNKLTQLFAIQRLTSYLVSSNPVPGRYSPNNSPERWFSLHFYVMARNKNARKKFILQALD